uniref:Myb-like domain-containing protein n=1 Tax=Oryza nivara TaxID=4536 RepID=A0A0E0GA18_ORYNI
MRTIGASGIGTRLWLFWAERRGEEQGRAWLCFFLRSSSGFSLAFGRRGRRFSGPPHWSAQRWTRTNLKAAEIEPNEGTEPSATTSHLTHCPAYLSVRARPCTPPPPPLPLQGHAKNLRARLLRFHTARVSGAFREQSLDGTLGYFGGFIELWMPNSPMLHQNGSVTGATKVPSLKKKGEHRISSGMQMSTNPNHYPVFPHSFCNQHVVSFQTSTIANGSGAIPVCPASSGGMNSDMTLLNTTPSTIVSTSSPNMLADSNQSLKYAAPMAVDWSYPELQLLNDGLLKYANEPGIMKYIKIAAMLPEKTVRDVAMRCQWMAAKKENTRRRKTDEHYLGKKTRDRKDKMVESSWATNRQVQTTDIRSPSTLACNTVRDNQFQSGASEIDRAMLNILEENARVLKQIGENIMTSQVQNNIDLFHHARRNISDLLQSMSQMPGIMSKMPPLPVSIDDRLASYILPGVNLVSFLLL